MITNGKERAHVRLSCAVAGKKSTRISQSLSIATVDFIRHELLLIIYGFTVPTAVVKQGYARQTAIMPRHTQCEMRLRSLPGPGLKTGVTRSCC